jgi:hypothetical protein
VFDAPVPGRDLIVAHTIVALVSIDAPLRVTKYDPPVDIVTVGSTTGAGSIFDRIFFRILEVELLVGQEIWMEAVFGRRACIEAAGEELEEEHHAAVQESTSWKELRRCA